MVDETTQGWQDLLDGLYGRGWVLVATQVHNDPGDVAQEGDRDRRVDEHEQGLHHAQTDDIVSTLGTVTCQHDTTGDTRDRQMTYTW